MLAAASPAAPIAATSCRFMAARGLAVDRVAAFSSAEPLIVGPTDVLVPPPRVARADPRLRRALVAALADCVRGGLHPSYMREYLALCGVPAADVSAATRRAYAGRMAAAGSPA